MDISELGMITNPPVITGTPMTSPRVTWSSHQVPAYKFYGKFSSVICELVAERSGNYSSIAYPLVAINGQRPCPT